MVVPVAPLEGGQRSMDELNLVAARASQATTGYTGAVVPREAHKGAYHCGAKEKHGCCFQRGLVMK